MSGTEAVAILAVDRHNMMHVVTSEGAARALRRAGLPGEIVVWHDRLDEGPVEGVPLQPDWLRARAIFWEHHTRGQISATDALSLLDTAARDILRAASEDEIVFWSDAGLADQLALIFWLKHFADEAAMNARCSFICSGERTGGRLCALNDLIPTQVKRLFETRRSLSPAILSLAREAWSAFCDADPRKILNLLEQDLSPLPHLKAAMIRHLQQFPNMAHGLSRLEYEGLAVVAMGYTKLVEIFVHVDQHEDRPHFNDVALWRCLDQLAREKNPLISVSGRETLPLWSAPRRLLEWTIWITDTGLEVLHGQKDRIRVNGLERQLGGVRFSGFRARWRWDNKKGTLVDLDEAN